MADVNVRAVITAEDRASNTMRGLSTTTVAVGTAIGQAISNLASRAMQELTQNIGEAVKRVDTLSNANRTFENMGFQAGAVKTTMDKLNQSILGLPTPLNEAVQGVELLASANNDIGKAQQVYSALNDAVLGFGGTAFMAQSATLQLSQDIAGGVLHASTWNSLLQDGLGPTLAAMARQMGLTTQALRDGLSNGTISVQAFQDELINLDKNGGGGLKSLHKIALDSTSGIQTSMENAKTAVTRAMASVIQAVGQKNISTAITQIGTAVASVIIAFGKLTSFLMTHRIVLVAVGVALAAVAGAALVLGAALLIALLPEITAGVAIAAAFGAAIAAVGAVIGVVAYLVHAHWGGISKFFQGVWSGVIQVFRDTWEIIKGITNAEWQLLWKIIKPYVDFQIAYYKTLVPIFTYIWDVARELAQVNWDIISHAIVKPAINEIVFNGNNMAIAYNTIWGMISGEAKGNWDYISAIQAGSWSYIRSVWSQAVGFFGQIWNIVAAGANAVGGAIENALVGAFSGAAYIIKGTINFLVDSVNGIIHGINNTAGKLPGVPKLGDIPHLASGTSFFEGGMALVGENGPEKVIMPRGSRVIPNNQINSSNSQTINVTVQAGAFMGSKADARRLAEQVAIALKDVAGAKNQTAAQYLGA